MLGESLEDTWIDERGVSGDRGWAIVDEMTGLVASAKHPRLWAILLSAQARLLDTDPAVVEIALPDGQVVRSDEPGHDDLLSSFVGRRVRLVSSTAATAEIERTDPDFDRLLSDGATIELGDPSRGTLAGASPAGTLFDYAPIHLITRQSLDELARLAPGADADVIRFRPNLVLDLDREPFSENDLAGHVVNVGKDVVLGVIVASPRCIVPTLDHGRHPRDPGVLRALARHNRPDVAGLGARPSLGAYAIVERAGRVSIGDHTQVTQHR